jgi:hypothetical protein
VIHEETSIYNYVPAAVHGFCSVADIIDESEHKQQHIADRYRHKFHFGPNGLADRNDNSVNPRPERESQPLRPERHLRPDRFDFVVQLAGSEHDGNQQIPNCI